MGRPIDHLVIAARSLERLAAQYEGLGFTLTPRAVHPDEMGTSNRLAQLPGRNFLELLEVDRPQGVTPHDFAADPPRFSFGDQNRIRLARGEGASLLVLQSEDAAADLADWRAKGLTTYAPFAFERQARQPDGSQVTVSFSLGFVGAPELPDLGFFVCHNRFPDSFWKPDYQRHANGAQKILSIYFAAERPAAVGEALSRITGGEVSPATGGVSVAAGPGESLEVMERSRLEDISRGGLPAASASADIVGIRLAAAGRAGSVTPAAEAGGLFIEWVAA